MPTSKFSTSKMICCYFIFLTFNCCCINHSPVSGKLPHKYKIVVAGNHEIGFEDGEEMNERQLAGLNMLGINKAYDMLSNCIYLCDRQIEVQC